ncbi:HD family phosphohydrolase [Rosettibacter firmus]|uniref:HD family phosphohydrolase n=1 Tax=Rosettibacter firmus TaxID=3111522 RepID=UPI00336BE1FB
MKRNLENILKENIRVKLLIVFITITLMVLMFPKGESIESEVTVGSIWIKDDLIASRTFEVLKDPAVYEKEKQDAISKILPIFVRDNKASEKFLDSINKFNKKLNELLQRDILQNKNSSKEIFLSESSYNTLLTLKKNPSRFTGLKVKSLNLILQNVVILLGRIYQRGLLNYDYKEIEKDSITFREGKYEKNLPKTFYFDRQSVNEFINTYLETNIGSNKEVNESLFEYITHFLTPNIIYSYDLTKAAKENAKEKIPRNIGIVNENERIVAKHDRITPEIKLKIDSYRIAKGEETSTLNKAAQELGKFIHISIVALPFILYIYLFRKKIYNDNLKILLIAIIFLIVSFITFLIYQINASIQLELLVLVPVASMLLTIIFDSRVGFYGTVTISLIVAGLRGNDYVFAVMNIVAGGLAAYTVRDIKNRTQIFRSFLYILIGYLISIIAFGLERYDSFNKMIVTIAFAASNALISPVFTYGLIIFIERIFKITTDLTLLELTDFNHPLLKELAKSAPGTFNHSMLMGTMVETAAEAIGANPILARVGAYYHDIGKILNPSSFIENQLHDENIHEKIQPEESVKLILDHVEKGIELAKKYDLPDEIINFIPMHHGTMIITYFYEKAKEINGEENVDVNDFRYKGPKPNTKETALVMLADACESTVRSLTNPEPQKIENVINNLIKARIDDGQLNDAPITFNDIKLIKEAFQNILIGQRHKRIRYPNQDELEVRKDEEN